MDTCPGGDHCCPACCDHSVTEIPLAYEADAEALPEFNRLRVADHTTPPCCSQPALCGGPHEDCYDATRAEILTYETLNADGTPADVWMDADACSNCDGVDPASCPFDHVDRRDVCDHLLPLFECGSCRRSNGSEGCAR